MRRTGYAVGLFTILLPALAHGAAGDLDPAFGSRMTAIGTLNDHASGLAIDASNRLVAVGYSNQGTEDFAVVRYTADGALDPSFGPVTSGRVTTPVGTGSDVARAVAVDASGRIVVVGSTVGTDSDFAVVRYQASGTLDYSFGFNGAVITSFSGISASANA